MSDERIAEVVSELGAIVERLDEIAFDALREAVAQGSTSRPALERRAVRARNAIERARRVLQSDDEKEGDDSEAP
ncbi:MAG: hypothetical protein WCF24_05935 [Acidimicrobiales bacterium]